MKKLLTFGDSYASYCWPMWPDLLAQEFDFTENYARPGCGNFYIFNSFSHYMLEHGISHEDTVIIQWTEPVRIDYIHPFNWADMGIYSAERLIEAGFSEVVSDNVMCLRQLTYMTMAAQLLSMAKCNWYFTFLNNNAMVHKNNVDQLQCTSGIIKRYKKMIEFLSTIKDRMIDDTSMTEYFSTTDMPLLVCSSHINGKHIEFNDNHPTPKYTMSFIKDFLIERLNIQSLEKMTSMADHSESVIREQVTINKSYDQNKTGKYFELMYAIHGYKKPIKNQ
jgi:hypothetical protein